MEIIEIRHTILSVNAAWQGRRFKTSAYKNYEKDLLLMLPNILIPQPPFKAYYEFGISAAMDWDNPIKPLQDILAKKYKFNDNQILEVFVRKVICKTPYFKFKLEHIYPLYNLQK